MIRNTLLIVLTFIMSAISPIKAFAQTDFFQCGQHIVEKEWLEKNPHLVSDIEKNKAEFNLFLKNYETQEHSLRTPPPIYTIPVVFHILHDNGPENISNAQVVDCIRIMNEDFSKTNADLSDVIPAFQSIVGNAEIKFVLAQKDPNGNCTNGIDRILTQATYTGNDNAKLNPWPRAKYLNIWVCNTIERPGVAGYSSFPVYYHNTPAIDGIIVLYNYVGSIGASFPQLAHTVSHEVGHWLNLPHTWGNDSPGLSTNCSDDDDVFDTPNTIGITNGSCNLSQTTCGSLDNVQNFMDYSSCSRMFTKNQASRMRAALASSLAQRSSLWQSSNLITTGTSGTNNLCKADFESDYTNVCQGNTIKFTDASYHGQTVWDWSFPYGDPSVSSLQTPTIKYYFPGMYDVSLTAKSGANSVSITKQNYLIVWPVPGAYVPLKEGFEGAGLPSTEWKISNYDGSVYGWSQTDAVSYSGGKCLKMTNFGNTSGTDEIESKTYDLSTLTGTATFKFKVAHAQKSSSSEDILRLYMSTNCGSSWILRWSKSSKNGLATAGITSTDFSPSGIAEWKEYSVSISSVYFREDLRFKFSFESQGGNNLYIDDINIEGTFNPVPILLWPPNNENSVSSTVSLDWKSVGDIDTYEYQVDRTPSFDSPDLIFGSNQYIDYSPTNSDTKKDLTNLTTGIKHYWRVRTVKSGNVSAWSSVWNFKVSDNGVGIRSESEKELDMKVYPNPIKESSLISFELKNPEKITINLYNSLGELISVFIDNVIMISGSHQISISNNELPSGIYTCQLLTENKKSTVRFVVE